MRHVHYHCAPVITGPGAIDGEGAEYRSAHWPCLGPGWLSGETFVALLISFAFFVILALAFGGSR